jgi:hypothetical protein
VATMIELKIDKIAIPEYAALSIFESTVVLKLSASQPINASPVSKKGTW